MKRILIAGSNGQVGWELQRALTPLGSVAAFDRSELDLASPDSIRAALRQASPDIIVNAAAHTAVDKAEAEPGLAMRINAQAPGILAEEAKRLGALLIHYSTDYVFDGAKSGGYIEEDEPHPLGVYGTSKLEGERAVTQSGCAHFILRTSWVYSARGSNFVLTILRLARERDELKVVDDQIGSPTWARALADATAGLIGRDPPLETCGLYHLAARGSVSRYHFAQKIVDIARRISGGDGKWAAIHPVTTADYPLPAARPLNSVLDSGKIKRALGIEMAPWEDQLAACLDDVVAAR
ncbi:MAG TPA: dTDP-4-dehydrorhamnose reductase [Burkholderiales bacterium]|nr:dTDP-4-dehydrorhamnose reductase [Burkholderiales bacterium]